MPDIIPLVIKYNGSTLRTSTESETITLNVAGKWLTDDITIECFQEASE